MAQRFPPSRTLLILLLLILVISQFGPPEQTLGTHVRSVYLHGAWVWTAIVTFWIAALLGVAGLARRSERLQRWSLAFGRSALAFWITYLPLSLWTMRLNWNGLFLQEPRWRVGLDFAVVGLLLQLAIWLIDRPALGSLVNALFAPALAYSIARAQQVMHPPSPIAQASSWVFPAFFSLLLLLCLLASWQLARWIGKYTLNPGS